ncbi:type I methionyl aminopeptidase [Sulfobacillus harzensis]|uniref:Methionine aminopeptidase n=1 Tax=Sulfobacillus harzensis TaxID=2729629 RepID=A0A7Y0L2B2_9FIRM|nr:type I methionyl aminopeptidase [Sulfobacillus harzensis]NMP21998.1 type I methionyl aminopeptidase [Sulfobacillus harzensis]
MIELKSARDREKMRRAGRVVGEVLAELRAAVKPGITTRELDHVADRGIKARGGIPVFKGYHGYPASVCVSVNDQVVHGIPGPRLLKPGDLVSIDLGATVDGFVGDAAFSTFVGEPPDERAAELVRVTEEALYRGIEQARVGQRLGDISAAVQQHVESHGFSVVRDFVGHGVGRQMHEEPQVPNYGTAGRGLLLKPGLAIAIEPMVNLGGYAVDVGDDGWTVTTRDHSLSAHFEHTIFIDDDGPEILTAIS